MNVNSLNRVRSFVTPWTVTHQASPSMGFSRQEYWSRLPFPSPGDLPDPGIELRSLALQADALTSEPLGKPYWAWVSALLRRETRYLALSSLCKDTQRRQPFASLKESFHQKLICWFLHLGLLSLQNYDRINFCCLIHSACSILLWKPE